MAHAALRRTVTAAVPQAHVHESMPYEDYLARLRGCDLFLDPFPYGNTNGIVDTVSQGLPGVCMTGRECMNAWTPRCSGGCGCRNG